MRVESWAFLRVAKKVVVTAVHWVELKAGKMVDVRVY